MDVIVERIDVFLLDIVEKNSDVEILFARNRFGADDDALAGNFFSNDFIEFLERQKQMDFEFGHRLQVPVDPAVGAAAADVFGFGDDIEFVAADFERDVIDKSRVTTPFVALLDH